MILKNNPSLYILGRVMYRIFAVLCCVFLASCGESKKIDISKTSVDFLYRDALKNIEQNRYNAASEELTTLMTEYPESSLVKNAQLMDAYAKFRASKYDDAIIALEEFIVFYPDHQNIDYAHYLKAICYYQQILGVNYDQSITEKTVAELQSVRTKFPGSVYAEDAGLKINLARNFIAGHEVEIGLFYAYKKDYIGAISRFKFVVDNYGNTSYVAEALYRLVEQCVTIGLKHEAVKYAAILAANYPESEWYRSAYDLLKLKNALQAKS